MEDEISFEIEDVEESDAKKNRKQAPDTDLIVGLSKSINTFKQATLDSFINCSPAASTSSEGSTLITRKRCSNHRSPFIVSKAVVDEEEKKAVLRIKASTPGYAVVVDEVDPERPSCSTDELTRMGDTIKKARRNSLYGHFDIMSKRLSLKDDHKVTEVIVNAGCKNIEPEEDKHDLEAFRSFEDLYPNLESLSNNDFVFIEVESIKPGQKPKPYPVDLAPSFEWTRTDKFVKLPFAPNSTNYARIKDALTEITIPMKSIFELEDCLGITCQVPGSVFDNIEHFFDEVLNEQLRTKYLSEVLPFMAKLALSAPTLITQPIPIMRSGFIGSITLSQEQVAALLSHAFFCTYERQGSEDCRLPNINFNSFFARRNRTAAEKLRCILHYFLCIYEKMPTGVITFRRQSRRAPNWRSLKNALPDFLVLSSGTIEDDGFGMLEMDFANKYIGGGVLRKGCVQEEIRFLICPELILSCLFCEVMKEDEAIIISGAQRYSNYKGYGRSFKWCPVSKKADTLKRDRFGRYLCEVVAIDALSYSSVEQQYNVRNINRELQKAYVGFYAPDGSKKGIATGNWGCGVYRGNPHLKCLLQLIAAAVNNKPVCYFTFFNEQLATELREIYGVLKDNGITVDVLYQLIVRYCTEFSSNRRPLFSYITDWVSRNTSSTTFGSTVD